MLLTEKGSGLLGHAPIPINYKLNRQATFVWLQCEWCLVLSSTVGKGIEWLDSVEFVTPVVQYRVTREC